MSHPPVKPTAVDEQAWELAASLSSSNCSWARAALRILAEWGQPTGLDAEADPVSFATALNKHERLGVRDLWSLARDRGLRSKPILGKHRRARQVMREVGVDPATVAFLRDHHATFRGHGSAVWWFIGQLRDHGLPTDLDVDLENGPVGAYIEGVLSHGMHGDLATMPAIRNPFSFFRGMVRKLYGTALSCDARRRPLPELIAYVRPRRSRAELWALLPPPDRERLERLVEDRLDELTKRQQAGKTRRQGRRKDTIAQGTLRGYVRVINSILRQASEDGWPLDLGKIFQPDHMVEWVLRGRQSDGAEMGTREPEERRSNLRGLFERAADVGEPLVPVERVEQIFAAIAADRGTANVKGQSRDARDLKFIPTYAQIQDAEAKVEEDFQRATLRYERNQLTYLSYWKAYQERTFFWTCLLGMWRRDTATTIDLLKATRDPETGIVQVGGVRAKQSRRDNGHYVDIVILPVAVDFIDEFLRFEGRSIERPLREGEQPVHLVAERKEIRGGRSVVVQTGQRWGNDVLKNEDLFVVPLWRVRPDSPNGLNYEQVDAMQRRILRSIGWLEAVPHTFRVAGAIDLRMRGFELDEIMEVGLWKSLEVLLECYARLNRQDRWARLAVKAPSARGSSTRRAQQLRRTAIIRIQRAAVEINASSDPTPADYERFEADCRGALDEVRRSNAASRGKEPTEPSETLMLRALVRADEALKDMNTNGLSDLVPELVLPSRRIAERARLAAKESRTSEDYRSLRSTLARRAMSRVRVDGSGS